MDNCCLYILNSKQTQFHFGGKGNGLLKLIHLKINVPLTYATKANIENSDQVLELNPPINFPLIIRSSADQEDHNDASLAGLFRSIKVEKQINWNKALYEVVESILTSQNDFGPKFKAGVVIQPWIETVRRGVAFSRNPNNFWSDTCCIEYAENVDDVVQGSSATNVILSTQKNLPSWTLEIFDIVRLLEKKMKSPVDVEWGITTDHKLYIFQCRPIAGSEANVLRKHLEKPHILWTRDLARERFPSCMTPLGWDVIEDGIPTNLKSLYEYFGLKTSTVGDLTLNDEGWIYHAEKFFNYPEGVKLNIVQFFKYRPWLILQLLFILFPLMLKNIFKNGLKDILRARITELVTDPLIKEVRFDMEQVLNLVPKLKKKLDEKKTLADDFIELTQMGKTFFKADLPIFLVKDLLFKSYQACWSKLKEEYSFLDYAGTLPHNISLKNANQHDTFLRRSWDIYYEANNHLQSTIGSKKMPPLPPLNSEWKRRIARIHQWIEWDEILHHYTGLFLEVSRRIIISCAESMLQKKIINTVDDIFFLKLEEIKHYVFSTQNDFSYYKNLTNFRKKRWLLRKNNEPDAILPPISKVTKKEMSMTVSKGYACGPYFFLDETSDLTKIPEQPFILVTKTANPAWIPLFPKMLGWITEMGGPLSHGFIAAREWGIPAVSAYPIEKIRELLPLTVIEVDGNKGEVRWN